MSLIIIDRGIEDICEMPKVQLFCNMTGRPRSDMRQFSAEEREEFFRQKKEEGFEVKPLFMPAQLFKPVQSQIDARRVLTFYYERAIKDPCDHEIIVSTINPDVPKIIDGHHHLACLLENGMQHAVGINDTVDNLLRKTPKRQ